MECFGGDLCSSPGGYAYGSTGHVISLCPAEPAQLMLQPLSLFHKMPGEGDEVCICSTYLEANDLPMHTNYNLPKQSGLSGLGLTTLVGKIPTPRIRSQGDPVKPGTRNNGIWNNGIIIAHAQ